jgi:ABC-type transport system involved in multi-copper enzyme maturation permease subunit
MSTLILNEMVVGEKIKATKDLGLSILNIFSLFIIIFLGINLVSRDISQKTLYFLFAKPVKKDDYLKGAYISVIISLIIGMLLLIIIIAFISFLLGDLWIGGLLNAGFFTFLEMLVVLSFAFLFVVATSPQLSMFLTLLVYVIGHSIEKAAKIVENSSNLLLKYFIQGIYPIIPNLEFFNKKTMIIYKMKMSLMCYIQAGIYALSYALLIFFFAILIFNKREL